MTPKKQDHSGEPPSGEGRRARGWRRKVPGPRHRHAGRSGEAKASACRVQAEERALSLGQNLMRGLDRVEAVPWGGAGQQWAGCGTAGDLAEVGWGACAQS